VQELVPVLLRRSILPLRDQGVVVLEQEAEMKITRQRTGIVIHLRDTRVIIDRAARYRRRLHEQGIWLTKDLKEIPVSQMENRHLLNVLRLLERVALEQAKREARPTICYPEPQGEMAQVAYWHEVDWEEEYGIDYEHYAICLLLRQPIFPHLVREALHRDLDIEVCGAPLADIPLGRP